MFELSLPQVIAIAAIPVLFAITVHEVAHGWMARRLGDRTAEMLGRLTLNPIKHIDPVGTVIVPLALVVMAKMTGAPLMIFGWAKPVPVSQHNLRNPRLHMAIVAAAGPLSNLLMAFFWVLVVLVAALAELPYVSEPLFHMGRIGVLVNLILAVLNMLPVPPLDGGRVLGNLLPARASDQFDRIEPYGMPIVFVLFMLGVLGALITPPVLFLQRLLYSIIGLG